MIPFPLHKNEWGGGGKYTLKTRSLRETTCTRIYFGTANLRNCATHLADSVVVVFIIVICQVSLKENFRKSRISGRRKYNSGAIRHIIFVYCKVANGNFRKRLFFYLTTI